MTGLASQVAPSADPKMLTSSDSCSMILVMASVNRKIRPSELLYIDHGPISFGIDHGFFRNDEGFHHDAEILAEGRHFGM